MSVSTAEKIEVQDPLFNLKTLPVFSIQTIRDFYEDPKVWGKDNKIHQDDELIHVLDNGIITTYTNDENTRLVYENAKPLTENFLKEYSDKASVYIESGFIEAESSEYCTKYVRKASGSKTYNGHKWSNSLSDIIIAWDCEDYRDLRLD